MRKTLILYGIFLAGIGCFAQQSSFILNKLEYFEREGVNVMAYQDIYPEGHREGVAVIMHGKRVATSGDLQLLDGRYVHNNGWFVVRSLVANAKIHAAIELLLTTGDEEYSDYLTGNKTAVIAGLNQIGWLIGRALPKINDPGFIALVRDSVRILSDDISKLSAETPFGVPYRPHIWGAGWDIQSFGVRQYYLYKAFPDIFSSAPIFNALNFILGVHPGENTSSFASGVGVRSATIAYGVNHADESYIPGGEASGTALIRPDFPELLDWPYLWQQQEYVMGGGSSNYMFLVLAADQLMTGK